MELVQPTAASGLTLGIPQTEATSSTEANGAQEGSQQPLLLTSQTPVSAGLDAKVEEILALEDHYDLPAVESQPLPEGHLDLPAVVTQPMHSGVHRDNQVRLISGELWELVGYPHWADIPVDASDATDAAELGGSACSLCGRRVWDLCRSCTSVKKRPEVKTGGWSALHSIRTNPPREGAGRRESSEWEYQGRTRSSKGSRSSQGF